MIVAQRKEVIKLVQEERKKGYKAKINYKRVSQELIDSISEVFHFLFTVIIKIYTDILTKTSSLFLIIIT